MAEGGLAGGRGAGTPRPILTPRAVPGWAEPVFPIGLSAGGPGGPPGFRGAAISGNTPQLIAGIRGGIDVIDLAGDHALEEDLATVRAVAPRHGKLLRVLVPGTGHGRRETGGGSTPPSPPGMQEIPVHRPDDPDHPKRGSRTATPTEWVLDLPSVEVEAEVVRSAIRDGAVLVRVPASLLDAGSLRNLARALPKGRGSLVIVDPFAQGRFDGRFLSPAPPFGSAPVPGTEADLRARFQPVLRFGFLPRPRVRSLGQASLRFLLGIPRVACVAVPGDRAESLEEALRLDRTPALTAAERRRVETLGAQPGSAPDGAGPG